MIKLLATTILGLGMLSNVASADVSHCGVNESRMNPIELSAYQECWLDAYGMDKDHGLIGSLFWVRVNGEYYSTQLKNLRSEAGRAAFSAQIGNDISSEYTETAIIAESGAEYIETVQTIHIIEERIVEVEKIIEIVKTVEVLVEVEVEVEKIVEIIKEKIVEVEVEVEVEKIVEVIIDNTDYDAIAKLEAEVAGLKADLVAEQTKADTLGAQLSSAGVEIASLKAQIAEMFSQAQLDAAVNAVTYKDGSKSNILDGADSQITVELTNGKTLTFGVGFAYNAGVTYGSGLTDVTSNDAEVIANAVENSTISWTSGSFEVVGNGIKWTATGTINVGGNAKAITSTGETSLSSLGLFTTAELEEAKATAKAAGVASVTVSTSMLNNTVTATLSNGKSATVDFSSVVNTAVGNAFDVDKMDKTKFHGSPTWVLIDETDAVTFYNAGYKAGEGDVGFVSGSISSVTGNGNITLELSNGVTHTINVNVETGGLSNLENAGSAWFDNNASGVYWDFDGGSFNSTITTVDQALQAIYNQGYAQAVFDKSINWTVTFNSGKTTATITDQSSAQTAVTAAFNAGVSSMTKTAATDAEIAADLAAAYTLDTSNNTEADMDVAWIGSFNTAYTWDLGALNLGYIVNGTWYQYGATVTMPATTLTIGDHTVTYAAQTISAGFSTTAVDAVAEAYGAAIAIVIEEAVETAYDLGYDDGYNDGYEDGYGDGYNDGWSDAEAHHGIN